MLRIEIVAESQNYITTITQIEGQNVPDTLLALTPFGKLNKFIKLAPNEGEPVSLR